MSGSYHPSWMWDSPLAHWNSTMSMRSYYLSHVINSSTLSHRKTILHPSKHPLYPLIFKHFKLDLHHIWSQSSAPNKYLLNSAKTICKPASPRFRVNVINALSVTSYSCPLFFNLCGDLSSE